MKNLPFEENTIAFNCKDQTRPSWMQRAELCADVLLSHVPLGSAELTLADIGCGDQKLKDALLNRELKFIYTGYDLIPQSPDVRLLDIAHESLPCAFDVAVMLGVIEYLDNLNEVFLRIASNVDYLVVSHVVRQSDIYSADRLKELGWINHLSCSELEILLSKSKFNILSSQLTPDSCTLVLLCKSAVIIETIERSL